MALVCFKFIILKFHEILFTYYFVMANLWGLNQGQLIMHYWYFMSIVMSWQYKTVEFREIPFIGYLVMTQFTDLLAIQGQ